MQNIRKDVCLCLTNCIQTVGFINDMIFSCRWICFLLMAESSVSLCGNCSTSVMKTPRAMLFSRKSEHQTGHQVVLSRDEDHVHIIT